MTVIIPKMFLIILAGTIYLIFDHQNWGHAHFVWRLKALHMVE
jgi:hypothetical protein